MDNIKQMTLNDLVKACTDIVKNKNNKLDYYAADKNTIRVFKDNKSIFKICRSIESEYLTINIKEGDCYELVITIPNTKEQAYYIIREKQEAYKAIKRLFDLCQNNNKVMKKAIAAKSQKQQILNKMVEMLRSM